MRPSNFLLPGLTAISFLGFSPSALADGREPGSLLIFPEFDNRTANVTMFTVTNTNTDFVHNPATNLPNGTVKVHFIYVGRVDASGATIPCLENNFETTLTPGDTFTFLTRTHNPNQSQGFMFAYAKHPTTNVPITFDYLIGNALFLNGTVAIDYSTNPVSLEGRTGAGNPTDVDSDGNRDLNGQEYEAMPDQIMIPRFLASTGVLRSELVMLGLSGGALFDTTFDFSIYNDSEEKFSAQRVVRCWERTPLDVISNQFTQTFLGGVLSQNPNEPLGASGRESGWILIDSTLASSGPETILNPAIYAVLVERVSRGAGAADLPFEYGYTNYGSLWPNGPNGDNGPADGY
ncbi:MAG: hypothetical protein ACKVXR_05310 [Planctomycetota bacterium]